jgi:GTP pyrophosphokinase
MNRLLEIDIDQELEKKITAKYRSLLNALKINKTFADTAVIRKSFNYALKTLQTSRRDSGELHIEYLCDVAKIAIEEIGLGITSVNAIFLSPVYRQNMLSIEQIKKEFDDDQLVIITTGLLKITDIDTTSNNKSQAENFRRLLLSLAGDMRVILIRIAGQVQVMRQMHKLPEEEQLKVASESSFLYAPLAHRLGLYILKSEMEDLSLKYTDPKNYKMIARKLDETMKARKTFIREFIAPIEERLEKQGFDFEIKGRPKSINSIWHKMKKKNVEFEDIYDLFAIRIIINSRMTNEKADCWQVYSAVTDIYQPNPKRMRDWISVPKTNGYESLHTTVVGPGGRWVEVQIRTQRMNEIAEKGFAAHWKYKGIEEEQGLDEWLIKIREILETPEPDAHEFIDDFKLSLYAKEIFVFTPTGELRKFPEGATVLDFAFDIHTEVGATCNGAKVNGRSVPIKYILQNGDNVEIIRSKNQSPKLDWLNYVVSSKAKSRIRQKLNEEKYTEAENGKEILKRRFKNWKIEFNDENVRKLLRHFDFKVAQDLYYGISIDKIDMSEVKEVVTREEQTHDEGRRINLDSIVGEDYKDKIRRSDDFLIIDEKVGNVDYKLAKCCNPIFGDKIFGFVTINEGIKIHRMNCPNAAQLLTKYDYRIVKAKWSRTDKETLFPVELKMTGVDDFEIITNINDLISKDQRVKMRSMNMERDDGLFEADIKLMVKDLKHLDNLIAKIHALKGVLYVSRVENV